IGFAGLKSFFEESQPQLLYALLPDYTGQGLALDAAAAIVRYCFEELGFDYLEASCDIPNLPSQRVAERIGMRKVEERTVDDKSLAFYRIENEKRGK
ncbi:MAG: GNAT family N-acetyltransferase, partial [Cyclobacteriaceae bacterium]